MEARTILILTERAEDPTVAHMRDVLRSDGVDPVIIAQATLEEPSSLQVMNDATGNGRSILRLGNRAIDLQKVHAAWLWRGWRPQRLLPRFRHLSEQRDAWTFYENEWAAFHKGFGLLLAHHGVFCVNPPPFGTAYEEKCCQLWTAAAVGLRIPPTLYTTRLPIVRDFYDEHAGSIIYKPFKPYISVVDLEVEGQVRASKLLTNRVRAGDLVEPEGFLPTPCVFQPYIPKQVELRIVVVGKRVFACAIHSQASDRTREDWRRYDLDNTPHEPYTLPADIERKILQLMERLGLIFGSVDMILTPEGEYVFLEVNPNGQFDWIARLAGLPIYEHLAAMLLDGCIDYSLDPYAEVLHAA